MNCGTCKWWGDVIKLAPPQLIGRCSFPLDLSKVPLSIEVRYQPMFDTEGTLCPCYERRTTECSVNEPKPTDQ